MEDRAQAETLSWDARTFEGRHQGHTRRIEVGPGELRITDTVESAGEQELEWTFPLEPGTVLEVHAEGLDFRAEDGWHSPSYGVRVPTKFLRARRPARAGPDVQELVLRVPS
jgi:hypothetical protein